MWKYECKRHLLYLLISAAAGAVLFGITIDDSFIKEHFIFTKGRSLE